MFYATKTKNLFLIQHSLYYEKIKNYYHHIFPKEQIKNLFFEELKRNNKEFYKNVLDFLQFYELHHKNINNKTNITKEVRFKLISSFINGPRKFAYKSNVRMLLPFLRKSGIIPATILIKDKLNVKDFAHKPQLEPELKAELKQYFREDIEKLEQLLDKDL